MGNKKERWKPFTIDGKKPRVPYVISDQGRFGVMENGKIRVRTFKPTAGVYRFNARVAGKSKAVFLYKEVAKAFVKKPSSKHNSIIRLDHDYLNDDASNLKWVTKEDHRSHTTFSPRSVLARKKKAIIISRHSKILNEKKVRALKEMIWDPKRKLPYGEIARKFGVSEMQIYRIKKGEFWYHIRVENEPAHKKYKQNLGNLNYQENKAAKKKPPEKKAVKKNITKKRPQTKNRTAKSSRKI